MTSKLLAALGFAKRVGHSRIEIESTLMRRGAEIVETMLGLDPIEFRLVCIPYDLYARFGLERGFGKWPHWTHLDGYQVMAGNRLRALAGGDSRFGGLYDLVSISPSDGNERIYTRFAVVRRARVRHCAGGDGADCSNLSDTSKDKISRRLLIY